jgi:hypothetical protein
VRVPGNTPLDFTWKIETVVLDNKEFPIETPFTWLRRTASPEDCAKREALEEDQLDAQIVWNFGYLTLEMLLGTTAMEALGRDGSVSWSRVKELTREHADLFELISGCYRHRYKERLSLKRFF